MDAMMEFVVGQEPAENGSKASPGTTDALFHTSQIQKVKLVDF
jgi:hypothetical protein